MRVTSSNEIRLDGAIIRQKDSALKLFMHYKKAGIMVRDKKVDERDALIPILKHFGLPRLIPVEPLDMRTEGLVLLTNNGEFAKYLLYDKNIVRKYRIRARGKLSDSSLSFLQKGIYFEGHRFRPMQIEYDQENKNENNENNDKKGSNQWIILTATEGKNRELRKLLEHLGLQISKITRIQYGRFSLGKLHSGDTKQIVVPKALQKDFAKVQKVKK